MRVRRKKIRTSHVPTASFGDIAFLLIIFFMIAAVFMRDAHIELTDPGAPALEKMEEAVVSISVDKHGVVWVDGSECAIQALASHIEFMLTDQKKKRVILRIDKDLVQEKYGPVLTALSEAGADIVLLGKKEGA